MRNMHPNTVLDIKWSDELQPVLDKLNRAIERGSNRHVYFYARALLRMLKQGIGPVTAQDVARHVYRHDAPNGGWVHWDHDRWCNFGGPVVAALKSDNPLGQLRARA